MTRALFADFSLQRPRFSPRPVYVGYEVKLLLGFFFSSPSLFPTQHHSTCALYSVASVSTDAPKASFLDVNGAADVRQKLDFNQ